MKTIRKSFTHITALVLSLLMLLLVFPADATSVFAVEPEEPEILEPVEEGDGETIELIPLDIEYDSADALYELNDLRNADTKYIQMDDDTVKALSYSMAVHRKDAEGVWKDIDNSLTENDNTVFSDRVSFSKKIGENGLLFSLDDGDYKITLSIPNAIVDTPVTVVSDGKSDEKFETKLEELSTLTKNISSVRFNGLLPNVDAEYILRGNDVKENLIINDYCENYTFTFELLLENLSAALAEDGSILLSAGEETAYVLPAPYMYDSEGDYSNDIYYTLDEVDAGRYALSVTPNEQWINEEERVFPVIVDPTITMTFGTETATITHQPPAQYSYFAVSETNCSYFKLSSNPNPLGMPILSATMQFTIASCSSGLAGAHIDMHSVDYTGELSNLNSGNVSNLTTHYVDTYIVNGTTTATYNLLNTDFLVKTFDNAPIFYRLSMTNNEYPEEIWFYSYAETNHPKPMLTVTYGYMPSVGLSGYVWIADTYHATSSYDISNIGILRTVNGGGITMTTYGSGQEARGQFQLITSSPGMHIYGGYDMVELYANGNVSGSTVKTSSSGEDWIILKLNSGKYVILLARDPRLAMTRTQSGVVVQTLDDDNDDELWVLYQGIYYANEPHPLDSGIYYINSNYTKTFLINNNGTLEMSDGTEAILGNKMAWQITYAGNGKYAVQSVESPNMFWTTCGLYMDEIGLSNSFPDHVTVEIEQIGSNYAFKTPVGNDYYYVNAWTYSVELDEYDNSSLWRLCKKSDYADLRFCVIQISA